MYTDSIKRLPDKPEPTTR